ncbi:hypothetical protein KBI52_08160 [Microvirga sp. HBU67558]|uniref:hypothetical protein n=1 Tax=Microvirga TaxID=186650 RepID=UPI001B35A7F0|nr:MULTISPECIES: hypothetical protein [unclassified Microvirga]MBQ0820183.1 hypothetical protein [Microvirga sp. HBU67558]
MTEKTRKTSAHALQMREPPHELEQNAIAAAAERVAARPKPVKVSMKADLVDGTIKTEMGSPHDNHEGWRIRLMDALGSRSSEFAHVEVERILGALVPLGGAPTEAQLNAVLAVINGAQPRDEIEAMLATQMAVTHALAMDLIGRTKQSPTVPYMETCGNLATKLQRTFVAQVETLAKLRRGGEQKVTVEHVHVHAGGQAIVGTVTRDASGGGGESQNNG